jgi:hypothetical protein
MDNARREARDRQPQDRAPRGREEILVRIIQGRLKDKEMEERRYRGKDSAADSQLADSKGKSRLLFG